MRIAKSWEEAMENRRHEIVLMVPSTWTWTFRVGVMMVLLAIWTGMTGQPDPTLGDFGVALMLAGLFAPFLITYIRAWGTMLRGSKSVEGS